MPKRMRTKSGDPVFTDLGDKIMERVLLTKNGKPVLTKNKEKQYIKRFYFK